MRTAPVVFRAMLEPLDAADLSGGADPEQLDLWPNECEGLCGV